MLHDAPASGLDARALLDRFGLSAGLLEDVDARVPVELAIRMWTEMPELTRDPAYGVHLAERMSASAGLSLAGHIVLASATVREGVSRLFRLERAFNDVEKSVVRDDESGLRHALRTRGGPVSVPPHAVQFAYSWLVLVERHATGVELRPSSVAFEQPRPASTRELERILGPNLAFDAAENAVAFSREVADLPHRTVSSELCAVLERHARSVIAALPAAAASIRDVRDAVADAVARGDTSIDLVARRLGVSPRTLQRRLERRGASFQAILDEVRRGLALAYLDDPRHGIAEIAFALDFADQSAFTRAFARWTGQSPGAYRKARRAAAP